MSHLSDAEPGTGFIAHGDAIKTMKALTKTHAGAFDLIMFSPPFVGLRGYIDPDDPFADYEIGQEATDDWIEKLLVVTDAAWKLLKDTGSLVIEVGDSYHGSGGAGTDYEEGGRRHGQRKFKGTAALEKENPLSYWPRHRSLICAPEALQVSLAYGINFLRPPADLYDTNEPAPYRHERWMVRNSVVWVKNSAGVGVLYDKYRNFHSKIIVAAKTKERWWRDWDSDERTSPNLSDVWELPSRETSLPAGSEHFATWPSSLVHRVIHRMCPEGGLVLDPFSGTGTTVRVATGMGRVGVGIELNAKNVTTSLDRIGPLIAHQIDVTDTGIEITS